MPDVAERHRDARLTLFPDVGVRPHGTLVGPDGQGRYRQTLRPKGLAGVVVPTAPPPAATESETIAGLRIAVAHLVDVVVVKAAAAAAQRDEALAEALKIREQFVGPRPAA